VIKDDLLTSAPIIRALCVTDLIVYQGDTLINWKGGSQINSIFL
jgi:hypothetical protein